MDVPVKTSAGAGAVIFVEMPWLLDATGKLDQLPTWWLAKSNVAKGGAFNP